MHFTPVRNDIRVLLFLLGAIIGYGYGLNLPVVNYLLEAALVVGFLYQVLTWGPAVTLITIGGGALLLYLASRFAGEPVHFVVTGTHFLGMAVTGMCLGWGSVHRWPAFRTLGAAILPGLVFFFFLIFNPFQLAEHFYASPASLEHIYTETTSGLGLGSDEEKEALYTKLYDFSRLVFPATTFVSTALNLVILYLLLQVTGRRFGIPVVALPPLSHWRLHFFWVWVLAVSLVAALWGTVFLKRLGFNLIICLGILFAAEGMAVIRHYFRSRHSSPVVEYGTYFLLYVTKFVSPLAVGLVGLFDLWFDFRKLNTIAHLKEKGTV